MRVSASSIDSPRCTWTVRLRSQCWLVQVDLSKAWLTFSSIVLAFAFVFGNNIRNIYEAVIFLFVVHPFDVGDVLLMGADQTWCQARSTGHAHTFNAICAVHAACHLGPSLFHSEKKSGGEGMRLGLMHPHEM